MIVKKAVFEASAADPAQMKTRLALPQIALVGRSNVGKSSLINTLCRQNKLARVSSTPGKTRLVNYFLVNDAFYLVDLPGYGFANVSRKEQGKWEAMVESYLGGDPGPDALLLLLDVRREPSAEDKQMAYWLQHYGIPCIIVATKADKLSGSAARTAARGLSDKVGMTFPTPTVLFSTRMPEPSREALGAALEGILKDIGS
ncbi:MAG: ribosome biogenesis GTP-binding protein YihA/YsxC [Christensenellales bacterium]|jgi:GTP-binding protein